MGSKEQWRYSLCNCFTGFESWLVCLEGWCFPCLLYGDNHHNFSQTGCCGPCCCGAICCPCFLPCNGGKLRKEIRRKYNIRRGCLPDWLVYTVCCWCACCQESKELKGRPLGDYMPPPELQGKQGNLKADNGGTEARTKLDAPPVQQITASGGGDRAVEMTKPASLGPDEEHDPQLSLV